MIYYPGAGENFPRSEDPLLKAEDLEVGDVAHEAITEFTREQFNAELDQFKTEQISEANINLIDEYYYLDLFLGGLESTILNNSDTLDVILDINPDLAEEIKQVAEKINPKIKEYIEQYTSPEIKAAIDAPRMDVEGKRQTVAFKEFLINLYIYLRSIGFDGQDITL